MKIKKESFHIIVIEITKLSNMDQDTGDKLNKKRFCVNPVICSKHTKKNSSTFETSANNI